MPSLGQVTLTWFNGGEQGSIAVVALEINERARIAVLGMLTRKLSRRIVIILIDGYVPSSSGTGSTRTTVTSSIGGGPTMTIGRQLTIFDVIGEATGNR